MRVEHGFEVLLAEFSLDQIEDEHGSVFGIFADGRLALTNTAWTRFVEENGAPHLPADWPLGRNIYEVIPAELQSFYREGWEWAGESGHPWSHSYECSSPDSYRRYRMTSYPIGGTAGILVVNSLVAQASWPDGTASPSTAVRTVSSLNARTAAEPSTLHPGAGTGCPSGCSAGRMTLMEPCAISARRTTTTRKHAPLQPGTDRRFEVPRGLSRWV